MFLLGFHRKFTALTLCKSIEFAIQWFQIHHRITFATIQNPAVYLSGARVSIFGTWDLFNISYSRELYLFSKFLHFEEIVRVKMAVCFEMIVSET